MNGITVTPLRDGPDYSGQIEIAIDTPDLFALDWDANENGAYPRLRIVLDSEQASYLGGETLNVIKQIKANEDPA